MAENDDKAQIIADAWDQVALTEWDATVWEAFLRGDHVIRISKSPPLFVEFTTRVIKRKGDGVMCHQITGTYDGHSHVVVTGPVFKQHGPWFTLDHA